MIIIKWWNALHKIHFFTIYWWMTKHTINWIQNTQSVYEIWNKHTHTHTHHSPIPNRQSMKKFHFNLLFFWISYVYFWNMELCHWWCCYLNSVTIIMKSFLVNRIKAVGKKKKKFFVRRCWMCIIIIIYNDQKFWNLEKSHFIWWWKNKKKK